MRTWRSALRQDISPPCLPRHTGEVPPKGAEGESHTGNLRRFRSEICRDLDWGFPPPALRATSPVRRGRQEKIYASVITILPPASRLAVASGGTTQVASYSSTISGPLRPVTRSERRRIGVSIQPAARPLPSPPK